MVIPWLLDLTLDLQPAIKSVFSVETILLPYRAESPSPQMRNSPSLALTARDLFGSDLSDLDDGPNDFLPDDNETDNGGDTGLDDSGALASSRFGSFSRVDLLDDDTNPSVKQEGEPTTKRPRTDTSAKDWHLDDKPFVAADQLMTSHLARAQLEAIPKLPWEASPVTNVSRPDFLKMIVLVGWM